MDSLCYMCFVFACYTVLPVPCCFLLTRWERADLLALLYVTFSCDFITFIYGVPGQVWYLILSFLIFAFFLTFFCCAVISVVSYFAIHSLGERERRESWFLYFHCLLISCSCLLFYVSSSRSRGLACNK